VVVRLVVLDVNETLFSLEPVADRLRSIGLEGQFELWFARILRDGFATTAAGSRVGFADLARHHLTSMLEQRGLDASDHVLDEVIAGFQVVTAHPDVGDGLRSLGDAGLTAITLTVGSADITRSFLEREGLTELIAAVYDAEATGWWKPSPRAYQHVLDEHGVRAEHAALIAVHPWDVMGAQQVGMVGAWLDRAGERYPDVFPAPTVTAASLPAIVDELV
jgi:2-haloacid dehalogenase